jgi:hypothetical protein
MSAILCLLASRLCPLFSQTPFPKDFYVFALSGFHVAQFNPQLTRTLTDIFECDTLSSGFCLLSSGFPDPPSSGLMSGGYFTVHAFFAIWALSTAEFNLRKSFAFYGFLLQICHFQN